MSDFDQELRLALAQRQSDQRYRQRYTVDSVQGAELLIDKQCFLAFCNNDYLGLANHPRVIGAFQQAVDTLGVGSGSSHLVSGHSNQHHQLEVDLARFTGRERALLFSTGYMANIGVISALAGRGDTVYEDRLNHASLIDGGLLSRATVKRYRHNDLEQLEHLLSNDTAKRKLVVVDGVFSMDGDVAPLPELAYLCRHYHAQLMVDDAHGFGVLGPHGGGCAEHFQLSTDELPILMGTLGKSFGTFGAFVAGSEALIDTLIQFARPYIYTTALPPAVAAATQESLRLFTAESYRREHLHTIIHYFRQGAHAIGLPMMESLTPIQPVMIGDDATLMAIAQQLREQSILVGAIRPPTVPEGTARLRITLNAHHTQTHVDRLLAACAAVIPSDVLTSECQPK